jgi:hypothetical protein
MVWYGVFSVCSGLWVGGWCGRAARADMEGSAVTG